MINKFIAAYNHQESSGFHSFLELQPRAMEKMEDGVSVPYYPVPFSSIMSPPLIFIVFLVCSDS